MPLLKDPLHSVRDAFSSYFPRRMGYGPVCPVFCCMFPLGFSQSPAKLGWFRCPLVQELVEGGPRPGGLELCKTCPKNPAA